MEFPRIFNANLRLIWAKCYLRNRWLHCIQTWYGNLFHTIGYYSAIIIFIARVLLRIMFTLCLDLLELTGLNLAQELRYKKGKYCSNIELAVDNLKLIQ